MTKYDQVVKQSSIVKDNVDGSALFSSHAASGGAERGATAPKPRMPGQIIPFPLSLALSSRQGAKIVMKSIVWVVRVVKRDVFRLDVS